MDLSLVKTLIIKEGRVKKILKGDTVIWNKIPFSIEITNDPAQTITGFKYLVNSSFTFTVNYHVPKTEQKQTPTWTVSGLPSGLSAKSLSDNNLTISGTPDRSGDYTVTVSVSKGSYSDTKTYTLNVDYGIVITTNNASTITDFTTGKSASKTFEASFNVPAEEQNSPIVWSFTNLPDGLSADGGTISGTATSLGTRTVTVTVKKSSYSNTKTFKFTVYGLAITTTSLPDGYRGANYSSNLRVTKVLPSDVGTLTYSATNLHSGLSLDGSKGVISGVPTTAGTRTISVYATQSPYKSATKTLSLNIIQTPIVTVGHVDGNSYDYVMLYATDVNKSANVGKYLSEYSQTNPRTELTVSGSNFNYATVKSSFYAVLNGGKDSLTTPRITVVPTIVSDTQITLKLKLSLRSTAYASALRNRQITHVYIPLTTYADTAHTIQLVDQPTIHLAIFMS